MSELAHDLLMLQFLSWIAERRRTYAETLEAWQSTCPRHTIWEDAVIDGYIALERDESTRDPAVRLTATGRALLHGGNGSSKPQPTGCHADRRSSPSR